MKSVKSSATATNERPFCERFFLLSLLVLLSTLFGGKGIWSPHTQTNTIHMNSIQSILLGLLLWFIYLAFIDYFFFISIHIKRHWLCIFHIPTVAVAMYEGRGLFCFFLAVVRLLNFEHFCLCAGVVFVCMMRKRVRLWTEWFGYGWMIRFCAIAPKNFHRTQINLTLFSVYFR